MRSQLARGVAVACTAALATVALAAPGTALAKSKTQCSGVNAEGQGASTQKIIQQNFWNKGFNESSDKYACNGSQGTGGKPTVKYNSTGSGAGLKSWGIENAETETPNFGPTNAYLGTDEPPSAAQIVDLEKEESTPTKESVLTIPVVQVAVSVIVNLPAGCTASSTASSGRLVLSQAELQEIYAGTLKEWGGLKAGGDEVKGTGCATDTIQPVVRQDQSGTTHIFKRFLNLLNSGGLETSKGTLTWGELSEGSLNTTWPTAAGTVHAEKSGGGELVAYVAGHPGSIGYASLADARANATFKKGGAGQEAFWVELENEVKGGKAKFIEPSTNGEAEATAAANCKKTAYSNGKNPFPPPAATEPWNEVTTKTSEKTYPLCGFSYAVSLAKYSLLPGTSAGEAETVKNYLQYATDKKGGQAILGTNDYEPLPSAVAKIATKAGVPLIGF
jgi:ABC-type phosphate transport system substrate-binding protein